MKNFELMVKAMILGIILFLTVFLVKPIGISTEFSVVGGIIHTMIDSRIIWEDNTKEYGYSSNNDYYDMDGGKIASAIKHPGDYDFLFILAMPLGGYIAYSIQKYIEGRHKRTEYRKISGKRASKYGGLIINFISGFLLLYGARMAGGCITQLIFNGIMQGSISGYIFLASVLCTAIPVALIVSYVGSEVI